MIGFKVQAYSYLKIKRELELQSATETKAKLPSFNPDTDKTFYEKLDSSDK